MNLRNKLGILSAKLVFRLLSKQSTSAPGLVALKIAPKLLSDVLSSFSQAPILITGTNGKSTSTGFLAHIFKLADKKFSYNSSGANLQSGLLTAILKEKSLNNLEQALLEVDEAVLSSITKSRKAKLILVNNFFRDQLDRFGEMDKTISLVQKGLNFESNGVLIANADDPNVCKLKADKIIYFGLSSQIWAGENNPEIHAAELGHCPICSSDLTYKAQWLGQFGDFYCQNCHYQKPKADIIISKLNLQVEFSEVEVEFTNTNQKLNLKIPLAGLFNVYNALGAVASAYTLGFSFEQIKIGIENYKPLFGRSQTVNYRNKKLKIFLIKNPIGATEVLRLINLDAKAKILILINDNYADSRDTCWLWDSHFEYLKDKNPIYISGSRASDMAIRLTFAGLDKIPYFREIKTALNAFCDENNDKENNLYILPTYTALLELTKLLKLEKK